MIVLLLSAAVIYLNARSLVLTVAIWAFVGLFALNTAGNVFAKSTVERLAFTPVTLVLAVLCLRLALHPV